MGLTFDASIPAPAQSPDGVDVPSVTTNPFSPPDGSIIVVFSGTGMGVSNPTSITDSLASQLSWSTNLTGGSSTNGTMAMNWANCPNAQTNMTVTVGYASTQALYIMPVVFTNAAPSPIGATSTADINAGSPLSISLTPSASGSYVIAGVIQNSSDAPTVPVGQTTIINGSDTVLHEAAHGTTGFVQYATTLTTAATPVTINDTAPTPGCGAVAVEILAAAGSILGVGLAN